jgi:hypothetical protein
MPENNNIMSVEGQLVGIPLQEYTAGPGIEIDNVNKVVTNTGNLISKSEPKYCGTYDGQKMYTKLYTFTATVTTSATTANFTIDELYGVNNVTRIWIDPSNSFIKYGGTNSTNIAPLTYYLGAGRMGSVFVNGMDTGKLSYRGIDNGTTALILNIAIRYTVSA